MPMLPEIIVIVAAFAMLFADLFVKEPRRGRFDAILCIGGLALAFAAAFLPRLSERRNARRTFRGRRHIKMVPIYFSHGRHRRSASFPRPAERRRAEKGSGESGIPVNITPCSCSPSPE